MKVNYKKTKVNQHRKKSHINRPIYNVIISIILYRAPLVNKYFLLTSSCHKFPCTMKLRHKIKRKRVYTSLERNVIDIFIVFQSKGESETKKMVRKPFQLRCQMMIVRVSVILKKGLFVVTLTDSSITWAEVIIRIQHQSQYLTLMMTSAQVVKTSISVTTNGPFQDYCTAPQMIPRPQMIPDRKWSPNWTANDPRPQMIPRLDHKWSR